MGINFAKKTFLAVGRRWLVKKWRKTNRSRNVPHRIGTTIQIHRTKDEKAFN